MPISICFSADQVELGDVEEYVKLSLKASEHTEWTFQEAPNRFKCFIYHCIHNKFVQKCLVLEECMHDTKDHTKLRTRNWLH